MRQQTSVACLSSQRSAFLASEESGSPFSSLVSIKPLPDTLSYICESGYGGEHRCSASYFMECSKGHIHCRSCVSVRREKSDDRCGYIERESGSRKVCEGRMCYETSNENEDEIEVYKPCPDLACGGWHKEGDYRVCNNSHGRHMLGILEKICSNVSHSETARLIELKKQHVPGFQVKHDNVVCAIQLIIDEWDIKGFPKYFNAPLPNNPVFCPERELGSLGVYRYPMSTPSLIFNAPLLWGKLTTMEWKDVTNDMKAWDIQKKVIVEAGAGTGYASLMLSIRGFETKPVDYSEKMYWQPDGGYFLPFTETDLTAIGPSFFSERDVLFFCYPGPQNFQCHCIDSYLKSSASEKMILFFYGKSVDYRLFNDSGSLEPKEFMALRGYNQVYKKEIGDTKCWELYK
ncbi:hypothetical protein ElyMa_000554900 [Elysia marginata]|uniref:Uncharacterized protein n=1 Tax=Elysia marginata TaxID=1093978 RepID=A0AAV4G1N5_9GAST|nr:hypothetical protein ElyMa_000554900 [Elysia marginata]